MTNVIAPEAAIGKVQLKVASLERSVDFYQRKLGFQLLSKEGSQAVLGAGDQALLTLTEVPGARAVRGTSGLYHFAVLLPDRRSLARLLYHLAESEVEIPGAADHGVSEALYLQDPDGNGIELYRDRRRNEWPVDDLGRLQMGTEELDIDDLVWELKSGLEPWQGLPENTTIGHVHLQVANMASAELFYTHVLGFQLMQRYGSAAIFVSAGGYHHHIGMNTWAGEGVPPPPADAAGLLWFEVVLPAQENLDAVLERLKDANVAAEPQADGVLVRDPSQNGILLRVK
jgi:catechol 2,3-dioxygenase